MKIIYAVFMLLSIQIMVSQEAKVLFYENFEDNNFESRGWYDQLKGKLTSDEHIDGSNFSLECKFPKGANVPEGGNPGRHLFEETDEVCLSYYVKYSQNYVGSGRPYHPHEFHFITNKDSKWVGPAFTHLTTYIEHNAGFPLLGLQDGENIDQSRVNENLVGISEERGVAGCNGSSDGYPDDCYKSGSKYVNGKQWKSETKYFSDTPCKYFKNDWHHIEAYFKLNSIVDGKGISDGIIKYWFDGQLIIDYNDILLRTGEHPDMKFNQFLITPYIGDGSPVEQTMWIDNLTVSTARITTGVVAELIDIRLHIIPNPATDFIEISQNNEASLIASENLQIFNMLGIDVSHAGGGVSGADGGGFRIDISTLPAGIYFIRIGDREEKFVKM